jgi:hypothetical protein
MLKAAVKLFATFAVIIGISRCVDPYSPKLKGYESLLVVDGLVTNKNSSYTVKLSRTFREQTATPVPVSDATIFITDNDGSEFVLKNSGSGIYKTDSTGFQGAIGKTYILHIRTAQDVEYESEPSVMLPVPEIDSIYFGKDQEIINNGTETGDGIRIYLDTKAGNDNKFFRWAFDETWKFGVPCPKKWDFVNETIMLPVADVKQYCWKMRKSEDIIIRSVFPWQSDNIEKEPIFFIDTRRSDRLLIKYSILIHQYSISKKEYEFWNNMKKVNESGGDIFSMQPFPIVSNIHNVNDPAEQILGYFQVSAVTDKRKYILLSDILGLNVPFYNYPCTRIEREPKDYKLQFGPLMSWEDLYQMVISSSGFYFVEPKYITGTTKLEKLVFAKPECADCEFTGTRTKPDFWTDTN